MPDPVKLLKTLRSARERILATRGRIGHLIELSDCEDVFVVGDLHGSVANFQALYRKADLANHPRRHLVLQELIHGKGCYPLGGDKSHQLVDLFAALKCQFPDRVHYLIGNHELAQSTGKPVMKDDRDLNGLFDAGLVEAYGELASEIREAYFALFEVCPLGIRLPNRIYLCHTLPHARHMERFSLDFIRRERYEPADLLYGGLVHSHLWGRDTDGENVGRFLNAVDCDFLICGHIPCDAGFAFPCDRLLVMDCAANPGGYATVDARMEYNEEIFRGVAHLVD